SMPICASTRSRVSAPVIPSVWIMSGSFFGLRVQAVEIVQAPSLSFPATRLYCNPGSTYICHLERAARDLALSTTYKIQRKIGPPESEVEGRLEMTNYDIAVFGEDRRG